MSRTKKKPKLTPEQRQQRRHEQSAQRKNAKLAAAHPLFVEQLHDEGAFVTRESEYWRWRFNRAAAAENIATVTGAALTGLKWIELHAIERFARGLLGDQDFTRLQTYQRRTYQDATGYGYTFWAGVLTGQKRVVYAWDRVPDPSLTGGIRLVEAGAFPPDGWVPPLTKDEFYRRFPFKYQEPTPHDDGGLAAKFADVFGV